MMDTAGLNERVAAHKKPLDRRKSTSTTGDGDQGDTCRICRGEGTPEQPLFYPCKCSGSIKFVHQDCLMQWLSHSQKKYCELCKTSFRFTKLYNPSMPATLPLPLFLRQVTVHAVKTSARYLRYICVTFIWTCWLPWSIRQIWRGLFWLVDGNWMTVQDLKNLSSLDMASATVDATTPSGSLFSSSPGTTISGNLPTVQAAFFDPVGELLNLFTGAPLLRGLLRLLSPRPVSVQASAVGTNTTTLDLPQLPQFTRQPSLLSNVSSLNAFTKYPVVNNCFIDVLEGQLICLSVIAAFILVFLIREWVINQQPILNMPNPDQAEVQVVPAPPIDAARLPGRGRPGRVQRGIDRGGQPEDRMTELAQRPMPAHQPHRAVTAESVTTLSTADHAVERSNVAPRSSSLNSSPTGMRRTVSMGRENVDSSWQLHEDVAVEHIESPPLLRGTFDDFVDIRRNIEEGMTQSFDRHNLDASTSANTGAAIFDNHSDVPPPYDDIFSTDRVQRTDFIPNQARVSIRRYELSADALSGSSTINGDDHGLEEEASQHNDTANTVSDDSGSPWESLGTPPNLSSLSPSAELQPSQDHEATQHDDAPEPVTSSSNEPRREVANGAAAPNLVDKVLQWMWQTDDQIQAQDQAAEQAEVGHAHAAHDRAPLLPANNANRVVPEQPPVNAAVHEPNVQFGVDLNDPNAVDDAEDLEGILELIGMEGPLAGMIQNFIFSIFLITLTLSASIWCPYLWGKIAILIMSNPVGVFVRAPLFFVSKCGNILVDLLLCIGGLIGFGLSNVTKLVRILITPALPALASHIKVAWIEHWTYGLSQSSGIRLEKALTETVFGMRPDLLTFSMQSHHALRVFKQASIEATSAIFGDISDTLGSASTAWRLHGLFGLPVFVFEEVVTFPNAVFQAVTATSQWRYDVAQRLQIQPLNTMTDHEASLIEWTTEDKIWAIMVGYAFFAIAGFAYLKIAHLVLGLKQDEKVDGIFADSLRQAGGVLKVIIIIGIEMIVFPLYCGLLLDCALLPLFRDATFQSRLAFLLHAPVTCLFIHWFVGTCYMFHFALFVSMCRKIMRKGVLYFIRDPDDPTFHPVRDVLERPVATQLGKIAFSALVYGGLVIVCLGGVVWTIGAVSGILPVQWSANEPRLAFPVDIIFYNFMLPFILRRAEISRKITAMYEWWFRQCAQQLRLSHFLFGEERDNEKLASKSPWKFAARNDDSIAAVLVEGQLPSSPHDTSGQHQRDGRYVRAPAADSVRIPKGTRVFVDVDERNNRIDNKPDRDIGMHGKKDERFIKIYIPPHFRARVSGFIFLVWLFAASTGVVFTLLPLLVGRQLISLTTGAQPAPNDLYAFTLGLHICGGIGIATYVLSSRMDAIRSKAVYMFTHTRESLPRLYQFTKHILGLVYLFTAVFVVLPFATSLLTELYIHMPVYSYVASHLSMSTPSPRSVSASSKTAAPTNPTIFILQTWTLGLLYLRLALRIAMAYPGGQNRPSTAIRAIVRNGYLRPDVKLASRALVLPALSLCIVLLAAPIGLARMALVATGTTAPARRLQFYRFSYPVLLALAVSVYAAIGLQHKVETWRVKVRDEVYLVGERLHNFTEPEKKNKLKNSLVQSVDKGKGKGKVAAEVVTGDESESTGLSLNADSDISSRVGGSAMVDGESNGEGHNVAETLVGNAESV